MSARVYLMKTVNGCKDISIISPQDEQWRRISLPCLYTVIFLPYACTQNKNKHCKYSRRKFYGLRLFSRYHYTKLIEFVTVIPCLLGHPVVSTPLKFSQTWYWQEINQNIRGGNLSSNLRDIKGIVNIISIHNVTLCAFYAISYL